MTGGKGHVARLLALIERVSLIIKACEVNEKNRPLYQNCYAYLFFRECVLAISNKDDYTYLD